LIIEDGAASDAAILIVAGSAVRIAGPAMQSPAEPVPTGALLGEIGMLIETEHTSTVIAQTDVRALRLVRADVHAQMEADPELAHHFVRRIADRLTDLAADLRRVDAALAGDFSPGFRPAMTEVSATALH
jgi:CRP-like cAMP-binding protein